MVALAMQAQAQEPSPTSAEHSAADVQMLTELANIYHIDRGQTLENYKLMFNADRLTAMKGAYFFEEKKGFDILAMGLARLEDSVKPRVINAILEKKTFGRRCFNALVTELDRMNSEDSASEANSGYEFLKGRIAKVLAAWLSLPVNNINDRSPESITAFSALAKQKAAKLGDGTPF
jgi:DNA-binding transcriptional MocR family regulator